MSDEKKTAPPPPPEPPEIRNVYESSDEAGADKEEFILED